MPEAATELFQLTADLPVQVANYPHLRYMGNKRQTNWGHPADLAYHHHVAGILYTPAISVRPHLGSQFSRPAQGACPKETGVIPIAVSMLTDGLPVVVSHPVLRG